MEVNGDEVQQVNITFENIFYTVCVPKQKGEQILIINRSLAAWEARHSKSSLTTF